MDALVRLVVVMLGMLTTFAVHAFNIPNATPNLPVAAFRRRKWINEHDNTQTSRMLQMSAKESEALKEDQRSLNPFESKSVGLYVHIPYCRQRCRYCDFAIVPVGDTTSATSRSTQGFLDMDLAYRDALLKELSLVTKNESQAKVSLRSIYFGGGTPSLAPIETLKLIMEAIMDPNESVFCLEPNAEVSIEIDPGTFNLSKLKALKDLGFNRFSLGVQSFDNGILESIGRFHRRDDIMESLAMIEQVYGEDANYSMDLISGLPGLSLAKWVETLEMAVSVSPQPSHLSLYDLQIESGTVFGKWYDQHRDEDDDMDDMLGRTRGSRPIDKMSPLRLPSANECAFMYKYASGYLRSKGYEHYEISSYALLDENRITKSSKRSTHNQIYWETDSQWYALGLGATSSIGGNRYARPRKMANYISWVAGQETKDVPDWTLTDGFKDDYLPDVIMTRLRTSDGLDLDWVCESSADGAEKLNAILDGAKLALELGLAERVQTGQGHGTLRLADPDGFLYSNSIISSIFVELELVSSQRKRFNLDKI